MRLYIRILFTVLILVATTSCTSYQSQQWRNGILVRETQSTATIGSSSYVVRENTQQYPNAVAEIGPMPGGMEQALAVQRVIANETRRNNNTLYGGMWGWGMGSYRYRSVYPYGVGMMPQRQIVMMPSMGRYSVQGGRYMHYSGW